MLQFEGRPHNVDRIEILDKEYGGFFVREPVRFRIPKSPDQPVKEFVYGDLYRHTGAVALDGTSDEFIWDQDVYYPIVGTHIAKRAIASAFGYSYEEPGDPGEVTERVVKS
jgi:hypothetical protein